MIGFTIYHGFFWKSVLVTPLNLTRLKLIVSDQLTFMPLSNRYIVAGAQVKGRRLHLSFVLEAVKKRIVSL
jgi:hypothetical protein